jgi:hypothetical protein
MRPALYTLCLLLTAVGVEHTNAASIALESATMGPGGRTGGHSVSANQLIGWRFHVTSPTAVTHVGGHLGSVSGYVFAALVSLNSLDAIPAGAPLPEQVVAKTLLTPPALTADMRVPLSAMLTPGSYALIFGSGQFGATGRALMPDVQQADIEPTTSSSFIAWRQTLPGEFRWTSGPDRLRFVVVGSAVAGPTDFNLDGRIDAGDLAIWRGHFDTSVPGGIATGDADRDDDTDGADFLAWQRGLGTGAPALTLTAAPEPGSLALVVQYSALAWLLVRGRARGCGQTL